MMKAFFKNLEVAPEQYLQEFWQAEVDEE